MKPQTIEQEMAQIITTALKPLRDTIAKVSASQKRVLANGRGEKK